VGPQNSPGKNPPQNAADKTEEGANDRGRSHQLISKVTRTQTTVGRASLALIHLRKFLTTAVHQAAKPTTKTSVQNECPNSLDTTDEPRYIHDSKGSKINLTAVSQQRIFFHVDMDGEAKGIMKTRSGKPRCPWSVLDACEERKILR
jgi:hypothetical protein